MSKNTVDQGRKRGNVPASRIKEAADRIGFQGSEAPGPDRTDEELDVLRKLAALAETIFESGEEIGDAGQSPIGILREALRSVKDDIELISDSNGTGSSVGFWPFRRAEFRIELALALAEYREQYPHNEADERPVPMAAGGAS